MIGASFEVKVFVSNVPPEFSSFSKVAFIPDMRYFEAVVPFLAELIKPRACKLASFLSGSSNGA